MVKNVLFLLCTGLSTLSLHAQTSVLEQPAVPLKVVLQERLETERKLLKSKLDSIEQVYGQEGTFTQEDMMIAQRMERVQQTVPLEYNPKVKAYLDKYTSKNYKPYMERLLGLSKYYFPIYESVFRETGIPKEVSYLSVVESSLDPHTHSTSGALGPWQFIYSTAKIFDLTMDGGYDERKDVVSSTYAVSRYLTEAYDEFNDWLLALASYNCGRGCVRRAIQRSGLRAPTFWELSPYLPTQTQNYIPKYVAMTYVLSHADVYGLEATSSVLHTPYKVMMVNRSVDLNDVAQAVNRPVDVLKEFNPAVKSTMLYGSSDHPKRIYVPYDEQVSDSVLYMALNTRTTDAQGTTVIAALDRGMHFGRAGESVASIAEKYGVSVKQILAWNDLKPNESVAGKHIFVQQPTETRLASLPESKKVPEKKAATSRAKAAKKAAAKPKYITHTVRRGDSLSSIASKYKGATVKKLKADNNIRGSHLSIGQKIKVY